jgi:hypothetical protein
MNRSFRSFCRVGVIALVGIGAMAACAAFADTNLVNKKFWVVDGTDDSATNASSITVSTNGYAVGAFTELAFSYNIDGTNVVPVGVVKGSGEIQMAVPYGPFGGSFFLTGYWDCDDHQSGHSVEGREGARAGVEGEDFQSGVDGGERL